MLFDHIQDRLWPGTYPVVVRQPSVDDFPLSVEQEDARPGDISGSWCIAMQHSVAGDHFKVFIGENFEG